MTQIFNKRSQITKRKLLRKNAPHPEHILWQAIRNRKANGQKFKRQFSIDKYVVDFYCPELRLVIEIDGGYHVKESVKEYDFERQRFIESLGINLLRFSDKEILNNLEGVLNKIKALTSSPALLLHKEKGEKVS